MIADMPSVNCDAGQRGRHALVMARQKLDTGYRAAKGQWTYVNQPVTLMGVRFFDFKHGRSGIADNAVVLHPVFGFKP